MEALGLEEQGYKNYIVTQKQTKSTLETYFTPAW